MQVALNGVGLVSRRETFRCQGGFSSDLFGVSEKLQGQEKSDAWAHPPRRNGGDSKGTHFGGTLSSYVTGEIRDRGEKSVDLRLK